MTTMTLELSDFHWTMQLLDTLDAGLVVIDRDYRVCAWNSFMQNYSGIHAEASWGRACLKRVQIYQKVGYVQNLSQPAN